MVEKPHIAKWNGVWAIWVSRNKGVPNAVPGNSLELAFESARWLYKGV